MQEAANISFGGGGGGGGGAPSINAGQSGTGAHRQGRYGGSEQARDAQGRFVGEGGAGGAGGGMFQGLGRGLLGLGAVGFAGQIGGYSAGQVTPGYGGVAARQQQRIAMGQTAGMTAGGALMMTGNPLLMAGGALLSIGSSFFGSRSRADLQRQANSAQMRQAVAERSISINMAMRRASFQGGNVFGDDASVQNDPFLMLKSGANLGMDPTETSQMIQQLTTAGGGGFSRDFMGRNKSLFADNLMQSLAAGISAQGMGNFSGQFRAGGGFRMGGGFEQRGIGGGELMMGLIRSGQQQGLGATGIEQMLSSFTRIGQMMEEKGMKIAPESILGFSESLRGHGGMNGPFAGAQGMRAAQTMIQSNLGARDKLLSPFQGLGQTMAMATALDKTGGNLVAATDLLEQGGPGFAADAVLGFGGQDSFLSQMVFRSMGFGGQQADVLASGGHRGVTTAGLADQLDTSFAMGGGLDIAAPDAPGAAVAQATKTLRQQQMISGAEAAGIIRSLANMEDAWVRTASTLEKYVTKNY